MKYFEVFKAGKYPQGTYTKEDIEKIALNYDPTFCEAPVTIDHLQSGPAYGWIDSAKADGDILKVSFKDVPDSMQKDINAGKYKKVSVELYKNLEGKGSYLKAVSFLGAAIPQVKGLEPIKFKESESDTFEMETNVDVNKYTQEDIDNLKKQINDLEVEIESYKEKEKTKKNETIKSLKERIEDLKNEVESFKEKAEKKDKLEKELADIKESIKNKEHNSFIEKQINEGRLVPANRDVVLSVLKELDSIQKFGEDTTVIKDFKSFIESLPNQIEFNEIATKNKQAAINTEADKFTDADEDSLEIFKEAKALAIKENISFKDALIKLNI